MPPKTKPKPSSQAPISKFFGSSEKSQKNLKLKTAEEITLSSPNTQSKTTIPEKDGPVGSKRKIQCVDPEITPDSDHCLIEAPHADEIENGQLDHHPEQTSLPLPSALSENEPNSTNPSNSSLISGNNTDNEHNPHASTEIEIEHAVKVQSTCDPRPSESKLTKFQEQFNSVLEACRCFDEDRMDQFLATERHPAQVFDSLDKDASIDDLLDKLVPVLNSIVQGSPLPLKELSNHALERLNTLAQEHLGHILPNVGLASLSEKIKLIAERKSYGIQPKGVVGNEDLTDAALWHWEAVLLDTFDKTSQAIIKEVRAERRRNGTHLKALEKLLMVLRKSPGDEVAISEQEEKVAKFSRQAEAARLKADQKRAREEEAQAKAKAKEEERAKREEEKHEKELERLKKEAEREEEKRVKAELRAKEKEEREKKREQELSERLEAERRQKKKMSVLNFFSPHFSRPTAKLDRTEEKDCSTSEENKLFSSPVPVQSKNWKNGFDHDHFDSVLFGRSKVPLHFQPSKQSDKKPDDPRPRMFRTLTVSYTRTADDNPFGQPYVEFMEKRFRNRMKFLAFEENVRPPYHGTFSRNSTKVKARRPLEKDDEIDYEYDSEAEWEQGDENEGESIGGSEADEEEEPGDALDYEDGWLRQEDDLGSDREGEEEVCLAKVVLDKKQVSDTLKAGQVIGPFFTSLPTLLPTEISEYLIIPLLGDGPLQISPPCSWEEDNAPVESERSVQPADLLERCKSLSDEMLKALVMLLKGSNTKKEDVIESFSKAFPGPSKRLLNLTITEIASRDRHSDGEMRWFIDRTVLPKVGLDDNDTFAMYQNLPDELLKELLEELLASNFKIEKLVAEFSERHTFVTRKVVRKTIQEVVAKKSGSPEDGEPGVGTLEVKKEYLEKFGLEGKPKEEINPLPWQKSVAGFFTQSQGKPKLATPNTPGRCSDGGWEEVKMSDPCDTLAAFGKPDTSNPCTPKAKLKINMNQTEEELLQNGDKEPNADDQKSSFGVEFPPSKKLKVYGKA